jgi:hypothetical protein
MTRRTLFVAWQDPVSRAILPVARLLVDGTSALERYEFAYINAIVSAEKHGFEPLLAFPDRSAVYRSDALFPLFANRVLQKGRPDYAEYVDQLGLDPANAEPVTIMARSGGRRMTDHVEVFAPPEPNDEGKLETHFLVRGVRHAAGAEAVAATLSPGDRLFPMIDLQNPANKGAIALRTEPKQIVGYLPEYLINELEMQAPNLLIRVERTNPPPAPVHHRILCKLTTEQSKAPFSGPDYQPVADGSRILAAE